MDQELRARRPGRRRRRRRGASVRPVSGSQTMKPRSVSSMPSRAGSTKRRSTVWPTASRTVSHSMVSRVVCRRTAARSGASRRRRAGSAWKRPRRARVPRRRSRISTGPRQLRRTIPSSSPSRISTSSAGISSRISREPESTSATVLSRSAVARDVERDLAQHGAPDVVGDVAAADDDDALAELAAGCRARRRAGTRRRRARPAASAPGIGSVRELLAPTAIDHARRGARAARRRRRRRRPRSRCSGLDAQRADDLDLGADQIARQAVLGDADCQHAGRTGSIS